MMVYSSFLILNIFYLILLVFELKKYKNFSFYRICAKVYKGYEITKEINELEVEEYIVNGIDKTITVGDLKKQLGDGYFIITYRGKEIPEDKMVIKGYYIGVKNIFNTFITVVKIN